MMQPLRSYVILAYKLTSNSLPLGQVTCDFSTSPQVLFCGSFVVTEPAKT